LEIGVLVCTDTFNKDLNALFIYLKLVLDLEVIAADVRLTPKCSPEDIALMIKQADTYKGYLAWAEICVSREKSQNNKMFLPKGNKRFAVEVLEELIEFYPENHEAYFRLWSLYETEPHKAIDVAEKMFLCCTNFHNISSGNTLEIK